MPTYEYRCPNGHDFDHFFRKISDGVAVWPCPVCGLPAERRMSGGAGLVFRGSGFYITDYGKDGKKDQRTAGATDMGKLRSTGETPAFFRASSGSGWALAGDAGHFKDPVTGQGMRDAMFAGRTLAERVLPALDDAEAVDRATRAWEAARDRECLPAYHFANSDTRVERQSAVICELVRDAGRTTEPDITDLFGRARTNASNAS